MRRKELLVMFAALLLACGGEKGEGTSDVRSSRDELRDGEVRSSNDEVKREADGAGQEIVAPHVEERDGFTVVWLAGTPYEMGYQQGELLHDTIAQAVEFVQSDVTLAALPMLAKDMGILDIAQASSYPDILEECQGLVDATADVGFTMDYCLTLNFGDVMLEFVESGVPEGPGCTGVIARGAATPDGRLRHTRNLDWGGMNIAIIHQHPVIFVRQPSDGIAHVYVGFPLNLSPYTGMNEAGISIGSHEANAAGKAELAATGRSHVQMVGQLLKSASSLADVDSFLQAQPHMSAEMLVVADGPGDTGAVFEMTATGIGRRDMEEDVVFATNHFVHPEMVAKHKPPSSGSQSRFARLTQLVRPDGEDTTWGALDEGGLAAVMRDTTNPHTKETPTLEELEALNWDNDGSIGANGPMHFALFDPARGLFWVAAGKLPIHTQPYRCFSLGELLGREDAMPCEPATL